MAKLAILGAIVSVLTFGMLEEPIGRAWGKAVARYHLAHGHYRMYMGGTPTMFPTYVRILKERYGFDEVYFVGCTGEPWDNGYLTGYTSVTDPEFDRMFGKELWKTVLYQAAAEYDANLPTPPR